MPQDEYLFVQEEIGYGSKREKGTEGYAGLAALSLFNHRQQANDTAGERAEKDDVEQTLIPQKGSNHRQ